MRVNAHQKETITFLLQKTGDMKQKVYLVNDKFIFNF